MVRTLFFIQDSKTLVSGYGGESGMVFWDVAQKRAQQTFSTSFRKVRFIPVRRDVGYPRWGKWGND